MPDLQTIRVVVANLLAVWGAIDLVMRLGRWVDRDADWDATDDHARRRRSLSDVTRGRRG